MIKLLNVSKVYDKGVKALNDVSLEFEEGELIVLKGVSGSGKSTLLSLIAGLTKPSSGEVIVDKKKISKMPDHFVSIYRRENIGFVFQKYNLINSLSVAENILLPLVPINLEKKECLERLDRVLSLFKIREKKEALVKNLSGGQQQRTAIARANINNPKIILADEPTANLDEKLSLEFIEILKELKSKNRTIIVATHDPLFFDLEFVDRVIEVKDGEILL
ncbi:MAG: ABC transporter ATP-binding protein [Campylobacterota bacterium]|nr:ABC transporter ATP-binding protein [Campylobacterota bacterium]